jgi:hypothetical protein
MSVLASGLALAAFAFLVHLVRWRVAPPKRTGRALIVTLVGAVFGGFAGLLVLAGVLPQLGELIPAGPVAWLHALLLALALCAAYVMTYPALEVESPTLVIVQAIARRGAEGIARRDLFEQLNDSVLLGPRVQDLLDEGLATCADGRYQPTAKGRTLARVFTLWRALLGASRGG